jgi:DNA-directed RNA polymerase subunit RPC12/RpoP
MTEAMTGIPETTLSKRCPSCGSDDVRPSRRKKLFRFFYELQGTKKYRCRQCRRSFFVALSPGVKETLRREEQARLSRRRGWKSFIQGTRERRTLEVLLFIGLLLVFFYTFNKLLRPDGSGILGVN